MDIRSSYPLPQPAPVLGHGGAIPSGADLPVNRMHADFTVEGSNTVKRLTPLEKGRVITLYFKGSPTFTNSNELLCPGLQDINFSPGDSAMVRSLGDGVWRVLAILRANPAADWNVNDFRVAIDSDHTNAIQRAVIAAQAQNANVAFSPGTYNVSGTVNITAGIGLKGANREAVKIAWTSTTLSVFNVATDHQIKVEGITFSGPTGATAGAIVTLAGGLTQNISSTFRDCTFIGGYDQIDATVAADWTIDNCVFYNYARFGVYVADTYNPDAGDSAIVNCSFATTTSTAVAVSQASSGGLKLVCNKIVGGSIGYNLSVSPSGASTLDLIIVGNSIEGQADFGILLQRVIGSNVFRNVVIANNQIAGPPVGIATDSNAGWISSLAITGNQITLGVGNGTCISLGAPADFIVDGNQCYGQTGTTVGIAVGGGAATGQIGVNGYNNLTTPISNASSSVLVTQRTQKGSSSATTSAAAGSLYSGFVAITFPVAFNSAPKVFCNVTSTGISAIATSITATGFTAYVWALANATAVPFDWMAHADA